MSFKTERAQASKTIAAEAMPSILEAMAAGRFAEADDLAVHAYHDGARPRDLFAEYDRQRGIQP